MIGAIVAAMVTGDVAPAIKSRVQGTSINSSATWAPAEILSTSTSGSAWRPVTVVDSAGNVHVAWADNSGLDGEGSDVDIYYKSWNMRTGQWSTIEVVSTGSTGDSDDPALCVDTVGNVHVAWEDNSDIAGSGIDYDIFYKVRDNVTGTWSATEVVSSESTAASEHPSIALDAAGNVHVVWDDLTNYGGHNDNQLDIFYKVRNSTTGAWNPVSIVTADSTQYAAQPSICIDNDNIIHMAYEDYGAPFFIGLAVEYLHCL
nr:hypothetical protein [Candidatus Sigynarchaeum springense]MDO8115690.1 hypothetical protein [Candidatus Sigynarchaeota archaeon]